MDQVSTLAEEIRAYCRSHADPTNAGKYARYFKEGYDAWGLLDKDNPIWNEQQKDWLERYRKIGLRGFLKLGEEMFRSGKYEEGALAIRFVTALLEDFDARSLAGVAKWFAAGIGNWAHVDTLCSLVLTPLLLEERITADSLAPWRESPHKYQRRAAVVALIGLLKTDADLARLLAFVRPMMLDPERVVHQGLGWFLREAWKKDPKPVEAFLAEWKDRAPRLIFQYATEKMTPAARARYRRAKT